MRTPLPAREKPRPLPEPLAAPAATNAENPAIDTVDELAVGGQTAAEAADVGGGVGGRGSGVEDGGEGAGGIVEQWQRWQAVSFRRSVLCVSAGGTPHPIGRYFPPAQAMIHSRLNVIESGKLPVK
ncbi:MAG: hypothetical protein AB7E55_31940 [Pigmentiphaga sp.]